MIEYPTAKKEWSMKRKIEAIKKAGFDGLAAIADQEASDLCGKLGLALMGGMDGSNVTKAKREMVRQRDLGVFTSFHHDHFLDALAIQLGRDDVAPWIDLLLICQRRGGQHFAIQRNACLAGS